MTEPEGKGYAVIALPEKKCSSVEDWDEYKEWKKRQALFVSKVAVMFGTDMELKEALRSQKSALKAKVQTLLDIFISEWYDNSWSYEQTMNELNELKERIIEAI